MLLDKNDILLGLERLNAKAQAAHIIVDLAIYGGAALALAFDMRTATRDVDAVIRSHPAFVRTAVREIAAEFNWPENWFNDGVKGFISGAEQLRLMQDYQGSDAGGLRVYIPTPEYLLAMKCMAMRIDDPEAAHDIADIKALARLLRLETPEAFFDIISQFYPSGKISPKAAFGVEEIAGQLKDERG